MITKIDKTNGTNQIFIIFDNNQKFRVYADGNKKYTKFMFDLAIENYKILLKKEILNKLILHKTIEDKIEIRKLFENI